MGLPPLGFRKVQLLSAGTNLNTYACDFSSPSLVKAKYDIVGWISFEVG